MPARSHDYDTIVAAISEAIGDLQAALRAALEAVLPDCSGARACGRALGVTLTLGWRCWTVAYAPEVPAVVARMPGPRGWTMLLDGFRRSGCPRDRVDRLVAAVRHVDRLLDTAEVTTTLLRSMAAGGLATHRESDAFRQARLAARTASETLHGVRCHANIAAIVVGPPGVDRTVDVASLSIFEGLERLRPGPAWPLYRWSLHPNSTQPMSTPRSSALSSSELPPLVPECSTPGVAGTALRSTASRSGGGNIDFTAMPRRRGRRLRVAFAETTRHAGRLPEDLEVSDLQVVTTVPVDRLVFDVLRHRSIECRGEPAAAMYPAADYVTACRLGSGEVPAFEAWRLPLEQTPTRLRDLALPASLAAIDAPYQELLRRCAASIGEEISAFEAHRIEVENPPLHGNILLRWRLL